MIVLTVIMLVISTGTVYCQEETPTPLPTPTSLPPHHQVVTTSTGSNLVIESTVTWGDIAITTAVLVLAAVEVVKGFALVKQWLPRNTPRL